MQTEIYHPISFSLPGVGDTVTSPGNKGNISFVALNSADPLHSRAFEQTQPQRHLQFPAPFQPGVCVFIKCSRRFVLPFDEIYI